MVATAVCSNCDNEIDEAARFCPYCGQAVAEEAEEEDTAVATKQCPHCYSQIDARASHCPNCGKAVKTAGFQYQAGTAVAALGLLLFIGGIFTDDLAIVAGLFLLGVGAMARIMA